MRYLSEILLQNHDIESFSGLVGAIRRYAAGERFLHMDIKPPFADTPENWEDVLEAAFTGVAGDDVARNERDDVARNERDDVARNERDD